MKPSRLSMELSQIKKFSIPIIGKIKNKNKNKNKNINTNKYKYKLKLKKNRKN